MATDTRQAQGIEREGAWPGSWLRLALTPRERRDVMAAPDVPGDADDAGQRLLARLEEEGTLPHLLADPSAARRLANVRGLQAHVKAARESSVAQGLVRAQELRRVLAVLAEAGIAALTFKGPLLAQHIHGDMAARWSTDLDVLVPAEDHPVAMRLLERAGLEPWIVTHPWMQRIAPRRRSVHLSDARGTNIDLHAGFSSPSFGLDLPPHVLWGTQRTLTLDGRPTPTLGAEVGLLYLAFHGAKHDWDQGSAIADVAGSLEADPALDWTLLRQLARATGTQRILRVALALASRGAGVQLPDDVEAWVARPSSLDGVTTAVLAERLADRHVVPARRERMRRLLTQRERVSDKVRLLLGRALGRMGG